jgi:hypothetical protein
MKLKTLINILQSSSSTEKILWKERGELYLQIKLIHSSFEDSTDPLSSPEMIVDSILQMTDKIRIYQREEIREEELIKKVSQDNVELIDTLKKIISEKNAEESKKEGSFFIELNKDELYNLFSLQEWRQKQLNELV